MKILENYTVVMNVRLCNYLKPPKYVCVHIYTYIADDEKSTYLDIEIIFHRSTLSINFLYFKKP